MGLRDRKIWSVLIIMRFFQRGFKPVFSIIVTLGMGLIGLFLGLALREYFITSKSVPVFLTPFKDMQHALPAYMYYLVLAFCVIGLLLGSIIGQVSAQKLVEAGNALDQMSSRDKIAVILGTIIGALISLVFIVFLSRAGWPGITLSILLSVAFIYLGVRATLGMKNEIPIWGPVKTEEVEENPTLNCKILDTNVIIDGRIADVCRTGFLEGTLYIPGFVLEELQHIADSADGLKRARGRRGLDILNTMQKELPLVVRTWDKSLDKSAVNDEVDTKLVKLARALDGIIVTNDFNLNKVAALQGVQVLNVNELANALKPVVLPGETMMVGIVREGKDPEQGVAYLDDGTMIVVEDGARFMNTTQRVVVTSVLQTAQGKMIFARSSTDEEAYGSDNGSARNQQPRFDGQPASAARRGDYSRGRAGKKI